MNLKQIYHSLKHDLEWINGELLKSIDTNYESLHASSVHLLKAGGKRMRPVFVLLAGRFGDYQKEKLKNVAVALELIHMASLVHDDVIDNAHTRRGQKTVRSEWDNRVAMYTGDYIFARALQLITEINQPEALLILSTAMKHMCLGEIDQIEDLYSSHQSLKRYLHRIKRKTALLMATSCQLGAMVSGANPSVVRLLKRYGYYVGMAFQLTDDVLDVVGDEKTLGKPAGSDLKQGNVTLPIIYTLNVCSEEEKEHILRYLSSKGTEGDLSAILSMVQRYGGIDYTLDLSKRYLEKAMNCLHQLPATPERESFRLIAEFIVNRSY